MEITKEWLEQKWIKEGNSLRNLSIEQGLGPRGLEKYAVKFKLKSRYKHFINEDKIDLSDANFQYLLGLIYSDGYFNGKRVSIDLSYNCGKELLTALNKYFENTCPIANYYNPKGEKVRYRLTISCNKLNELLKSLGIDNNKTIDLKLPILSNYSHFLRGFFDGDGSIDNKRIRWYCHSKRFNKEIVNILGYGNISNVKGKSGTQFAIYKIADRIKFLKYIYRNADFSLNYKKQRAFKFIKEYATDTS